MNWLVEHYRRLVLGLTWGPWFLPIPLGIFVVILRDSLTVSFDWRQNFQLGNALLTEGGSLHWKYKLGDSEKMLPHSELPSDPVLNGGHS